MIRGAQELNFDPTAERTARQAEIERQTQQSREQMARIFGLTPAQIQSGQAIRASAGIEGGRLANLAALESELSQRAGAEQRANIATQQGALGQQQTFGLQQAGLFGKAGTPAAGQQTLGGREVSIAETNAAMQRALDQGQLTGQFVDPQTGRSYQTLQAELGRANIGLGAGELSLRTELGRGQLSISQQAQDLSNRIQSGQLSLAQAAQDLNRQVSLGQLSIAQANQILQETQAFGADSSGRQTLQGRAQIEEERRNRAIESLQSRGVAVTEQGLAEEVRQNKIQEALAQGNLALAQEIQRGQLALGGRAQTVQEEMAQEERRRNQALEELQRRGVVVTEQSMAEEVRRNQAQEQLQSRGVTVTEKSLDEQMRQNLVEEAIQQGNLGVAQDQMRLNQEIQRGTLAIQQEAQRFGQRVTEAELTGMYRTLGQQDVNGFMGAYGKADGQTGFKREYDYNGNGRVDFDDFAEFQNKYNAVTETLGSQQVKAAITNASRALGIDERRITEGARQFNASYYQSEANRLTQATGYVYDPNTLQPVQKKTPTPYEFTQDEWVQSLGQPATGPYAKFDLDGDGTITRTDLENVSGLSWSTGGMLFFLGSSMQPLTTQDREEFDRQKFEQDRLFEDSMKKWMDQMGITKEQIAADKSGQTLAALAGLASAGMGLLSDWLTRKRK